VVTSTDLVPWQAVTGRDKAQAWANMETDLRRRSAMAAAAAHDAADLFDLLHGYMLVKSRAKTAISASTLKSYRLAVRQLNQAWSQENLLHPSQDAGDRYIGDLAEYLAPASCDVRLRGARALYRALHWARATEADPFCDVRAPKNPTPKHERRRPYPDADVDALLEHADLSDGVLYLLCAHGGLRISEALALRFADVDFRGVTLRIISGKGGGARTVQLSATLAAALGELRRRHGGEYVIVNAYGRPYRDPTIPRVHLQADCEAAEITYRGFHALRHTAGTRLMRESGNLQIVAAHLGHANVATSAIYAKWSDAEVASRVGAW
jgi:integrase